MIGGSPARMRVEKIAMIPVYGLNGDWRQSFLSRLAHGVWGVACDRHVLTRGYARDLAATNRAVGVPVTVCKVGNVALARGDDSVDRATCGPFAVDDLR